VRFANMFRAPSAPCSSWQRTNEDVVGLWVEKDEEKVEEKDEERDEDADGEKACPTVCVCSGQMVLACKSN
jgi:hypothetical protein